MWCLIETDLQKTSERWSLMTFARTCDSCSRRTFANSFGLRVRFSRWCFPSTFRKRMVVSYRTPHSTNSRILTATWISAGQLVFLDAQKFVLPCLSARIPYDECTHTYVSYRPACPQIGDPPSAFWYNGPLFSGPLHKFTVVLLGIAWNPFQISERCVCLGSSSDKICGIVRASVSESSGSCVVPSAVIISLVLDD